MGFSGDPSDTVGTGSPYQELASAKGRRVKDRGDMWILILMAGGEGECVSGCAGDVYDRVEDVTDVMTFWGI